MNHCFHLLGDELTGRKIGELRRTGGKRAYADKSLQGYAKA
jgi:hypothetical protein